MLLRCQISYSVPPSFHGLHVVYRTPEPAIFGRATIPVMPRARWASILRADDSHPARENLVSEFVHSVRNPHNNLNPPFRGFRLLTTGRKFTGGSFLTLVLIRPPVPGNIVCRGTPRPICGNFTGVRSFGFILTGSASIHPFPRVALYSCVGF